MSALAVIDSLEFARTGQQLSGSIAVDNLVRLHDELLDRSGHIDYTVAGGYDDRSRPVLRLSVKGRLHLRCQRCLGLLHFPVDLASTLLLDESGDGMQSDDPEEPELIEASGALDLTGLVEDEILLGLPIAPRHASGACGGPDDGPARDSGAAGPFAALAVLKKRARSIR